MAALKSLDIRASVAGDRAALESLYPRAFPDEDLLALLRDLLRDSENVVSLVATDETQLVGHIVFTHCGVAGSGARAALLGPLAVAPDRQRQGVGSRLVRAGLRHLVDADVELVLVLGDPAYYGRLGFGPEALVEPPYELPVEWSGAWQSQYLTSGSGPYVGKLIVPGLWRRPELWAP